LKQKPIWLGDLKNIRESLMTCWQRLLTAKLFSRAVEAAMFFRKAAGFFVEEQSESGPAVTFSWTKANFCYGY